MTGKLDLRSLAAPSATRGNRLWNRFWNRLWNRLCSPYYIQTSLNMLLNLAYVAAGGILGQPVI